MQAASSPMDCMDLDRFFIIFILYFLQKVSSVVGFLQSADAGGQLADGLHGLGKILLHSHNKYLQNECELFSLSRRERCAAQPSMAVL